MGGTDGVVADSLEDSHDEAVALLAVASQRQASAVEEAVAALRESHDVELASLRETHEQALVTMTNQQEQIKAQLATVEADREVDANLVRQLKEEIGKLETDLVSVRERAEEELRTLTEAAKHETEARTRALKESEESYQRQIRTLEETLEKARVETEALLAKNTAAMAEEHQNALQTLATQHTLALTALQEDLTKSHTAITNATITAFDTKLSTAFAAHEADLETLREAHSRALDTLQEQHAVAVEQLTSELATWKTSHNDRVNALRQEHEKEQTAWRAAQDETIARLHTQLIAAQAASVDAEKEREAASERAEQLQLALVELQESKSQESEAAKAEAQNKIVQLEANIGQLTQELESERAEGERRDSEMVALAERMNEKEALLVEARGSLQEAQQQCETERTKSDQLLREKTALEGDFQTQHDQLQAELDKARVHLQEVEGTVVTLRNEHAAMREEVVEISSARNAAVLAAQQAHDEATQVLESQRATLVSGHDRGQHPYLATLLQPTLSSSTDLDLLHLCQFYLDLRPQITRKPLR